MCSISFSWSNLMTKNICICLHGLPCSSAVKESTCNAVDPVQLLGREVPLKKGSAAHSKCSWASLVAQMVKNLPAMQENWVWSLGWDDPLEEAWQRTPVFLPGESRRQRSLVGYSPWGCKEWNMTEWLSIYIYMLLSRFSRVRLCATP